MQTNALRFNQGAFHRTQATILAYDIIDRMRANRVQALTSFGYVHALSSIVPVAPNCAAADCTPAQIATYDLSQWKTQVINRLPEGQAQIGFATTGPSGTARIYTVTTQWKGRDVDTTLAPANQTTLKTVTLQIRSEI